MSESDLMREVMMAVSKAGAVIFRNNVGQGWIGRDAVRYSAPGTVSVMPGDVVIRNGRPLHAGLIKGSGDLIGWLPHNGVARFLNLETKTRVGKLTEEQLNFHNRVISAGGISGVPRSVAEAVDIIRRARG